jgi:hypothetical protein
MINEKNARKMQAISDAYVKLVKKELGADMICNWGALDSKNQLLSTGMSMSGHLTDTQMNVIYFNMQRNLFLNLTPYDKDRDQEL